MKPVMSYQEYLMHSLACPDTVFMWLLFVAVMFIITSIVASALSHIPDLVRFYSYKKMLSQHK
jgi:hypothetical protein